MLYALDIETSCKMGCEKICMHALREHQANIDLIGVWAPDGLQHCFTNINDFKSWFLSRSDIKLVGQNFKFDIRHLVYHCPELKEPLIKAWIGDTSILAALLPSIPKDYLQKYNDKRERLNKQIKGAHYRIGTKHSLKVLAPFYLGVEPFWEVPGTYNDITYCLKDCEYTYKLYEYFNDSIKAHDIKYNFYYKRLHPYTKVILESELRGVQIDNKRFHTLLSTYSSDVKRLSDKLYTIFSKECDQYYKTQKKKVENKYFKMQEKRLVKAKDKEKTIKHYSELQKKAIKKIKPFNFDSPKQLLWLLKRRKLSALNIEGKKSTGKEVLQRLSTLNPELKVLMDYKHKSKLLHGFLLQFPEKFIRDDWTLHTTYRINGTRTGRLSSASPNIQQIPPELRSMIVPRKGYSFICRDVQNIEPLIAAYASSDPNLIDMLLKGHNFHNINTCVFFDIPMEKHTEIKKLYPRERDLAKRLGLGIIYGLRANGIQRIARSFGFEWSLRKCKKVCDNFLIYYKILFGWAEKLKQSFMELKGENLLHRPIYCDEEEIGHKALNTFIQSSASDLVLNVMYNSFNEIKKRDLDAMPLLLVHDEIVMECRDDQVTEVANIIDKCFQKYNLTTPYGKLILKTTGGQGKEWLK